MAAYCCQDGIIECLLNIYTMKRWKMVFITLEGHDNKRVVSWLNTQEHLDKQQAAANEVSYGQAI